MIDFIIMGYAVFPDIVDGTDGWQDKVVDRFAKQQFLQNLDTCRNAIFKYWLQELAQLQGCKQDQNNDRAIRRLLSY